MKVSIAMTVTGALLVVGGVALVSVPLALVCGGAALVVSGLFRETGSKG